MVGQTSEKLSLLLQYFSLIGIWFAIPSVSLLLQKDSRWPIAISILIIILFLFFLAYIFDWHVLFPKTSDQVLDEENKL
tara:strand:+ start:232 stop:468 length:237 start_codon:yes stop_codon:yes gene_type:complete